MVTSASAGKGSSDESIGRPANWREGRYQERDKPIDASVNKPSQTDDEPHDTVGTQTPPAQGPANAVKPKPVKGDPTVTREDYEARSGTER